jgi:hypothetical protein
MSGALPLIPFDVAIDLNPGQEWYSVPFSVNQGDRVRVNGAGTVRFYLDVFDTVRVDRVLHPPGGVRRGPFPFRFGSDRQAWDIDFKAPVRGAYQVVARLGIFNPAGRVRIGARYAYP